MTMHPIELDKPSKAPIDAGASEEIRLHLHDVENDGHRGTIVRDEQGNLAFPSYVPPDVEQPTSRPRATSEGIPDRSKAPDLAEGPKKTKSDSVAGPLPKLPKSSSFTHRRKAHRSSTFSALPLMKRAKSNLSAFDTALRGGWNRDDDDHDYTDDSSRSSSDAEDSEANADGHASPPKRKPRRKRPDDKFRRFRVVNDLYHTKGKVSKRDGRLSITVNDTSSTGYLAKALGTAVKKIVPQKSTEIRTDQRPTPTRLSSATTAASEKSRRPKLNIVIMVIGSRGDAQPFLKIGKVLKEEYGHRVRIATHPAFRDFVEKDSGLEFFSVGGDPSELMAFMVKNPGMIPTLETVRAGDIGRRRAAMAEMFDGFWRACINATDNEKDINNVKMMGKKDPFVADAIIANPPSFAHIHCAEALGIPLHLMFTFPYTPTQAFPHPLANIKKSNVDPGYTNFISYPLVEMMVWQGLGDLVNSFRVKTLGLDPVSTLWAPGATYRLHVPVTYLWSPGLVPKPDDWSEEIDVSGFVFLDLASSFEPPKDLINFLDNGEMPIYIGFGSIVVDNAERFTEMIFNAVRSAGVRALVSKGWGGLGQDYVPENIYMVDNIPHDWLFPRVRACVIHGGAGTTAIALKCGKPTMVVPFFGDQYFWGSMVGNAGAGPAPVPYKKLNEERLVEGIRFCMTNEALEAAQRISRSIELEGDGAKNAVRAFHRSLNLSGENSMRCSILDDHVAVWRVRHTDLKLSALAADVVVNHGLIPWRKLRLMRHKEFNDFEGPGEPITGIVASLVGTVGNVFAGIGSVPYRLAKTSNRRAEKRKKKEKRTRQRQEARAGHSVGFPFENASSSTATTPASAPLQHSHEEYLNDVEEGAGRTGRALAHAPVDLFLALAQGFHNAPRLYGDDTVRRPIRVTGIRSGLKAAGYEFVYGLYDGFTGLVRLPIRGAKEDGIRGAIAGVAMGLTGFVLKDIAALIGPIGYTLKGIAKQCERGKQPIKYLRRARIIQAQRELSALTEAERKIMVETVLKGWQVLRDLAVLIMLERERRQFIPRFNNKQSGNSKDNKSLTKYGKGLAFESVTAAEKAIEAIAQGESIDAVLKKRGKPLDSLKTSTDEETSQDVIMNSAHGESNEDTHRLDRSEENTVNLH
ncbi:glycosyltransferase family 1 protein [Annulohypoxylon truncatum]|uniref:glycosyltransferase family 1 protein n=1 Tax=Annulohypoxylon truncatum TaxID=327061 RepID=UPI0020081F68|nr:glycosyltransferase family 1 protein [Annulohypoxylon truncatum]KAI1213308.1 glycosyltransferase family 1 protein [Annulohypoxylon truncatum]